MKKVLSVILAMGMLASSTAALATTPIPPVEEMEISTVVEESTPAYISVTGTIMANAEFLNIVDGDAEYDLVITENTLIYNNIGEKLTADALTADTKISAFINANEPAVLVMPPRYTPAVVIVETEEMSAVTVDTFYTAQDTLRLTNTQNTLALNLAEETKIVNKDGETYTGDLEGKDLVVFHTISTMSIPAQTTPELVIVLNDEVAEEMPIGFISQTGTVTEIGEFVNVLDGENEFEFVLTDDTLIFNQKGEKIEKESIAKDAQVSIFVDGNQPMPLIFPPRYTPAVVVVLDAENPTAVEVDRFSKTEDGSFVDSQNTLVVHHNEDVKTVDEEGNAFTGELDGRALVVFYTMSTRSLPPQTTPDLVIVLDEAEAEKTFDPHMIYNKVIVNGKEITIGTDDASITGMVPVRAVAETLGYTVAWDQGLQAVSIGTVPMGVNFKLGENAYNKARMMPFVLSKAPLKIAIDDPRYGVTFVPVDFFTEVLGATARSEGDIVYIEAETPDFSVEA